MSRSWWVSMWIATSLLVKFMALPFYQGLGEKLRGCAYAPSCYICYVCDFRTQLPLPYPKKDWCDAKPWLTVGAFCAGRNAGVPFGIWLVLKCEWAHHTSGHTGAYPGSMAEVQSCSGCSVLHSCGIPGELSCCSIQHPTLRQAPERHTMLCTTAGAAAELGSWAEHSKGVQWQHTLGVRAPGWVLTRAAGLPSLCCAGNFLGQDSCPEPPQSWAVLY